MLLKYSKVFYDVLLAVKLVVYFLLLFIVYKESLNVKKVSKMKSKGRGRAKAVKKGKTVKKTGAVSPLRLLSDNKMEQLKKEHASGKSTGKQLAKKYKVSISTLYNYLNR
jgi:hypothetical protein